MGYITNYSYCTVMVSETVINILQTRAKPWFSNHSWAVYIKPLIIITIIIIMIIIIMIITEQSTLFYNEFYHCLNSLYTLWNFFVFSSPIHCQQFLKIHNCSPFFFLPRRQNRTGSLHTANRFHDEAGKLLLHLFPTLRTSTGVKPLRAVQIATPEVHTPL